jgi:hypothetical protein
VSIANGFRLAAGGAPPSGRRSGGAERALEQAAWHVWPALLSGRFSSNPTVSIPVPLADDLGRDPNLGPVLKPRRGRTLLLSPGQGSSRYTPLSLSGDILRFGGERAERASPSPELATLVNGSLEGLRLVRRLGRGQQVSMPAVIAFADVTVPREWAVQTKFGVLREALPQDRERGEVGLVLETELPVRMSAERFDPGWDWRQVSGRDEHLRARQLAADRVTLAFALAFGSAAVPRVAWTHLCNPPR